MATTLQSDLARILTVMHCRLMQDVFTAVCIWVRFLGEMGILPLGNHHVAQFDWPFNHESNLSIGLLFRGSNDVDQRTGVASMSHDNSKGSGASMLSSNKPFVLIRA